MKEAPYPQDTRARGWRFEVDHEQVAQSDTWSLAKPELRPWLLMLWMTAWSQTPCGSLPGDDAIIAAKIGMPAKLFARHRATLMRGWWMAADGRYYHPTITERVLTMLNARDHDRARMARSRAQRSVTPSKSKRVTRDTTVTPPELHSDTTVTPLGLHRESTVSSTPVEEQEQEQEQEQKQDQKQDQKQQGASTDVEAPTRSDPVPIESIVAAYNSTMERLPKVRVLTAKRRQMIRSAWQAAPQFRSLDFWCAYFAECADDNFLNGTGPYTNGHENWRPDLDYLLRQGTVAKVFERAIDRAERAA